MESKAITIGEIIKARVESLGISKAELARRMNMSPANVYKVFKRTSLDVDMLRRFSLVLKYDFISHYYYLTGATVANRPVALPDHDPATYMRSLHRKIAEVLTASREAIVNPAPWPAQLLVADIDFIQDILHDMLADHHPKHPDL